jgi:hypothetical protein
MDDVKIGVSIGQEWPVCLTAAARLEGMVVESQ